MWRNCRQQSIIIGMAKYRGGVYLEYRWRENESCGSGVSS
jgi:hypothetical protein